MVASNRPPANAFVAQARKVYNPIGFSKGYNAILWFIFCGALMGFILARFQYLSFTGVFCKLGSHGGSGGAPGECFYYGAGHERIGIQLHLYGIIPAGFLACFQFVPMIRHKVILFHRINGYLIILLVLTSIAGAVMIGRTAFGGLLSTQAGVGVLAMICPASLGISYYNIKRLQIDQHRAWMLRAWFYMGSIITLRIILILSALIITQMGDYYFSQPCEKLDFILNGEDHTLAKYPECSAYYSGESPNKYATTHANFNGGPDEIGTALNMSFGMALWLALFMHAVGVEIYLQLTPAEANRLRKVSYERQLEAGFKNPGNAGLTVERLGDAEPWVPVGEKRGSASELRLMATAPNRGLSPSPDLYKSSGEHRPHHAEGTV